MLYNHPFKASLSADICFISTIALYICIFFQEHMKQKQSSETKNLHSPILRCSCFLEDEYTD